MAIEPKNVQIPLAIEYWIHCFQEDCPSFPLFFLGWSELYSFQRIGLFIWKGMGVRGEVPHVQGHER